MRILVTTIALAVIALAEDINDTKSKRTPVQSSKTNNANLNSLQEFQNSGKQPSSDGSTYTLNDIESQNPNANLQPQISQISQQQPQPQFAIPAQYTPQTLHQPSNLRPNIPYQIPQQYHQQPVQMILVPHPMAHHGGSPSIVPISYSSNPTPLILTPHANMLFNQAAQQLLHYYQTHPQARLQLLQGYQPQYQIVPSAAQPAGIGATTHLAPSATLYHQQTQPLNIAANPANFQASIQYQPPQSSPQQSQSPSTSASTPSLNALEYLPQPEKLIAASPQFLAPFPLRTPYKPRF